MNKQNDAKLKSSNRANETDVRELENNRTYCKLLIQEWTKLWTNQRPKTHYSLKNQIIKWTNKMNIQISMHYKWPVST